MKMHSTSRLSRHSYEFEKGYYGSDLVIIGPQRFQNSLMAATLTKELEIPCFCEDQVELMINSGCRRLILCDGHGRKEFTEVFEEFSLLYKQLIPGNLIAFFNIRRDARIVHRDSLARGIRGIFFENEPLDMFLKGIRTILKGEYWFSRELLNRWIPETRRAMDSEPDSATLLTRREKEVLKLVATGASNEEIASSLAISFHTVKTHLTNIFKKLNLPNRLQASLWAARNLE